MSEEAKRGRPSVREQIEAAKRELQRLDATTQEAEDEKANRTDAKIGAMQKALADRKKRSPSGTPGYPSRAKQLGIPAAAVPRCGIEVLGRHPCKQPAGAGTDHYGIGPCRYHGGLSTNGSVTHGRYSGLFKQSIDDTLSHFVQDNDPLNLLPDIALVRTLTERFINQYDDWYAAILAWHDSYSQGREGPQKPVKILELNDVHKMLDTLTKAVASERKARAENAISARDLYRIMSEIGRIIETYVQDEETLKKIREQMLSIRHA